MSRISSRLLTILGLVVLPLLVVVPSQTLASPLARGNTSASCASTTTLTIWTNANMWAGLTPQTSGEGGTGSIASYYRYYGALWAKQFPCVKIKEVFIAGANGSNVMSTEASKTILAVNAGDPPDIVGNDVYTGQMVARHVVMNLDSYYKAAGITASYFIPGVAAAAQVGGHWYGMPGASGPSRGDLLYIPAQVKAAGWDPNKIPTTWDQLWTATQKVTQFDSKGNLVRIGVPVTGAGTDQANEYCGYFATYDRAAQKYHLNLPCVQAYFTFEKKLLDFYGGVAKYTKFISGDPSVWSCSKNAYLPTGKILFAIDAYWSGGQMDNCYNAVWALGFAPTPHGTPAERKAVDVTAWNLMIPVGAKHPQLAFDFVKFTNWEHGYLQGPTTNGYVKAGQGTLWAQDLERTSAATRAKNHYPGTPMVDALARVDIPESEVGTVGLTSDLADGYVNDQLSRAWSQIEYGRQSVSQALNQVQQLVDNQQRMLRVQAGM